jgi:hypothetical protein
VDKAPDCMLSNDEIKMICEKHKLSRREVYEIRSSFSSMCKMSGDQRREVGVDVQYYIRSVGFLKGALETISRRILFAAGKFIF